MMVFEGTFLSCTVSRLIFPVPPPPPLPLTYVCRSDLGNLSNSVPSSLVP